MANQETMLVAATECLSDMPARDLAKRLVEAEARALDMERNLDESNERNLNLRRTINAAECILGTVCQVVGARDLLTYCEVVRCEILRRRETE